MKFHLCGGLDAPDWILAEITTLGKLSPIQLKQLTLYIIQHILEGSFDYDNVGKLTSGFLGPSDLKACIATLRFFVTNAAKFDADEDTLSRELQQLGLPKEHTDSLCRPYSDSKGELQEKFLEESLQLPTLNIDGWQVRTGKGKSILLHLKNSEILKKDEGSFNGLVYLAEDKFRILLQELKMARSMMKELT